jgi:hypothetical protein
LVWPEDGAVISHVSPPHVNPLSWTDSLSCIPDADYLVELSTDASFAHAESASTRYTYAVIGRAHEFPTPLTNCTQYYWRVRLDFADDSADGPWSPVWSFYTNEGGMCAGMPRIWITPIPPFDFPIPTMEASSWIDGYVWHDLCAVPYASTDIVHPGCIAMPGGGFEANGIAEAGEPGLEGVTVDLGAGPCPSTGLATTTTASGGHYTFGPLPAGTYCVSINPLSDANISVLIPGSFTFPVRGCDVAEYEITLSDADIRRENNFGWDFQFLPSPGSGTPIAKLLRNANCRRGPSIDYESLTTLFQGLEVPIDGRNTDNSWWWVRIPNSLNHCWLGGEMVQTAGDLSKVPIVEAEPLGCWVQGPNDPSAKCTVPCPQGAKPGGACEP